MQRVGHDSADTWGCPQESTKWGPGVSLRFQSSSTQSSGPRLQLWPCVLSQLQRHFHSELRLGQNPNDKNITIKNRKTNINTTASLIETWARYMESLSEFLAQRIFGINILSSQRQGEFKVNPQSLGRRLLLSKYLLTVWLSQPAPGHTSGKEDMQGDGASPQVCCGGLRASLVCASKGFKV